MSKASSENPEHKLGDNPVSSQTENIRKWSFSCCDSSLAAAAFVGWAWLPTVFQHVPRTPWAELVFPCILLKAHSATIAHNI